ncbi:hypothetical protein B0H19DRAFT_1158902 [Mycena capillaripes]|nr:hypothetical protein B0H19DRAFT_1158902 [Mycena capillaripes]
MLGSPGPCGLPNLPNELIHAIAEYCDRRDLLALCQTNRRIHAICLGPIYRVITLHDLDQVVRCCRTIISCAQAAESVREFQVSSFPRLALKSFYSTVGCAIRRLTNVQSLLVSNSHTIFRSFSDAHFPHISECTLPSSASIFPFLKRNPTIITLHVLPCIEGLGPIIDPDSVFEVTSPLESIHMPNLQGFVGAANVGCAIVPQPLASRITIYWGINLPMSFSDGLAALSLSKADVIELNNLIGAWDCTLVSEIGKHLPRVERLLFRNISAHGGKERFFEFIQDTLPSLPSLKSLALLEGFPIGSSTDDLDEEFATVRRWGEICPGLCSVTLLSNTHWGIFFGAWFPGICDVTTVILDGHIDAAAMGHFKWFFKTTATSPSLPHPYHRLARLLAGEDGILAMRRAIERTGDLPDFVFTQEEEQVDGSRIAFLSYASDSGSTSETDSESASDES